MGGFAAVSGGGMSGTQVRKRPEVSDPYQLHQDDMATEPIPARSPTMNQGQQGLQRFSRESTYSSEPGTAMGGRVGTLMPGANGAKYNAGGGVYSGTGGGGGGGASAAAAGGGGGAPAAPPAIPGGGIPITNTAQNSPNIDWLQDKFKDRFNQDNTKRAIDRSNLGIADSAALMAADQQGGLARRGATGTGTADTFLNKRVFQPAQQQAAKAAADISMGRERDLDQLTLGGLPIMRAQDDINLANRGLGIQQLGVQQQGILGQQGIDLQRQQLEQQRKDQEMSRWLALMGGM